MDDSENDNKLEGEVNKDKEVVQTENEEFDNLPEDDNENTELKLENKLEADVVKEDSKQEDENMDDKKVSEKKSEDSEEPKPDELGNENENLDENQEKPIVNDLEESKPTNEDEKDKINDIEEVGNDQNVNEELEESNVDNAKDAKEDAKEDANEDANKDGNEDSNKDANVVSDEGNKKDDGENEDGENEKKNDIEEDGLAEKEDGVDIDKKSIKDTDENAEETKVEDKIQEQSGEPKLDETDEMMQTGTRLSPVADENDEDEALSKGVKSIPIPESPTDGNYNQLIYGENEEEEEEEEEELEEELLISEDEEQKRREAYYKEYLDLLEERNQAMVKNAQYQHRIFEYYRRKKMDDGMHTETDKAVDNEQRYMKYLSQLKELQNQFDSEETSAKDNLSEFKTTCCEKQSLTNKMFDEFLDYKKQIALKAVSTRSSKNITEREIDFQLSKERKKEEEVSQVRLENHKLKRKLQNKEQQLKSKEELAEGLHLIDFEQLKIENQTYNEKIEERNEELLKLRKKITSTVQVLTHLKEKLQHVHLENALKETNLKEVEQNAARRRDLLSRTKQVRDALRNDNLKLRQNCGLLGNELLLRDFEDKVDEANSLKTKLNELKMHHAQLTLSGNGIRQKIEQANRKT